MYNEFKHTYVIGGGTIVNVSPHFALSAPAYGTFARKLYNKFPFYTDKGFAYHCGKNLHLILTKMAKGSGWPQRYTPHIEMIMKEAGIEKIETNEELDSLVSVLISRNDTKAIIMNCAICDFRPSFIEETDAGLISITGTTNRRLSSTSDYTIGLTKAEKILSKIRKIRKDIFLVAFKTTSNATVEQQYTAGLSLLKRSSCNLVVANDITTKNNFIITPEEAMYHETTDRDALAKNLAEMICYRSQLTFTRATVVDGQPIPWNSPLVPNALRTVVNHMIGKGAYKPFEGRTVGHFAAKIGEKSFLTSIRKTNFNDIEKNGLVRVKTDGFDWVLAYGTKPSVGGQSQRIIFDKHQGYDCIVHAHVPIKEGSLVPIVSQREYECGSHECGENTANNLRHFNDEILAVMLDKHGPNIVFKSSIDPQRVIDFIEDNFILSEKTK